MAATLAQLKQRVRDNCYGPYPTSHPFASVLGAAIADGSTQTVTVADGTDWAEGDVLEVQETEEQCLVRSVSGNDLTVIRGWNGTTPAAATDGGTVLKNPRFSLNQISNSIASAVAVLPSWGIHTFGTGTIAYDNTKHFFEVSESMVEPFGVLSVYYVEDNTEIPRPLPFTKAVFNLSTTPGEYSSGAGITILDWGDVGTGESVYYTYAKPYTDSTLSDSVAELVVLAAVALVFGKSIIPRSQDPGARTDRTMPVGQEVRDSRWYQGEFFIRARVEAADCAVRRGNVPGTVRLNRARRWRS